MPVERVFPALFVLLWATGFIGARYAMPWAEPFTFLSVRFTIACAIFAAAQAVLRRPSVAPAQVPHAVIAGALIHGVYLGGVFWAVRNGMPAGLSALLVGFQPIITTLLARPVLGEIVTMRHWVALGAGLAGAVIVLWPKLDVAGSGIDASNLGACLAGVIAMALGTVWQKRFVKGADLVASTTLQYVGGAAMTGIAALLFEHGRFELTGELVFATVWLVLVLSVGAIFLLMVLIDRGAVSGVASLFYLVPSVTALIAYVLFGETLTLVQIGGMAITAAAVAAATSRPVRQARGGDGA